MINKNYTILHCHTMLSNGVTNIDSVTKYNQYAKKAKDCNMKAFAFSEHGNVFEWLHKKNELEKLGIKYIHAEEFYITETLEEKIRDNYHCLLIAKNYDGFLELNKLSSKSFNRKDNSFYYVPRICFEDLINTSDNIIITTACLGGILNKGHSNIKNRFFKFIRKNRHRCFLELQPHQSQVQCDYNILLNNLSHKYNIECVMCTDTHALNNEHVKGRQILQKSKKIHFEGEDEFDLTFKTYDELVECCKLQNAIPLEDYLIAIENTNKIADMVDEFTLDYSFKYPKLWGENSEQVLRDKIEQGLISRGINTLPNLQEYLDRIEYEMKAYIHNGAIDFMLLMEDIVGFCKREDIGIGYGRGSANGSVVAYLLHITEMDSIKHNLNFDRFMSTSRISLSDIDTDFPPSRINDVKNYIFSKHGLYCSDIVTFNTIALKGAIRDVSRALEYDLKLVGEICDNIEQNEQKYRDEFKELFEYVDLIQGTVVSVGSHPCGLVTSPLSIDNGLGLFSTSTSEYPISQINMKEIDSLNYVKLDLLKLDTIEIINETCKLANIERRTPDNLNTEDDLVWNSMRDDTTQIFQWEGETGERYIKKLLSDENVKNFKKSLSDIDKMTLLSIGNGAIRPAGAGYREELASGTVRSSGSKPIDDFLKPTFGQLVFQEQILQFLFEYCGFTMGEADIVRRQFAKKTGTEHSIPIIKYGGYLTENKEHYIKGFIQIMKEKYSIEKDEAEKIAVYFIDVIEKASNYLFSLNHSSPYSYLGYASGWLRYYYPLEFLTVSLNTNNGKEEKTKSLIIYANKVGIPILSPKFGKSKAEYFMDKQSNSIYKGIGSIKFMNSQVSNDLYDLSKNEFKGWLDLYSNIKSQTSLNSKQLNILIELNYFEQFGSIHYLKTCVEYFDKFAKSKTLTKDKLSKYEQDCLQGCYGKETEKQYRDIDNNKFISNLLLKQSYKENTTLDLIKNEIDLLSYSNITDTTYDDTSFCVQSTEKNQWGTTFATLYQINNGKTKTVYVDKKNMSEYPALEQGVMISGIIKEEPKSRKATDEELIINPKTQWYRTGEMKEVLSVWCEL